MRSDVGSASSREDLVKAFEALLAVKETELRRLCGQLKLEASKSSAAVASVRREAE